jgi:hypothetical protein
MVTTGPVGKPLGIATSGTRIVTLGERSLCDQYFGLGNLPNQIDANSLEGCVASGHEEPAHPGNSIH